jgi:hypothetical protein
MRKLVAIIFATLGTFCTPATAMADATAIEILAFYDKANAAAKSEFESYFAAREDAFGWANAYLKAQRKIEPLYCPPSQLVLTGSQIIDTMRRQIKEVPGLGELPYGAVMLQSLQMVFPCPS